MNFELSGTIPTELGKLENLQELWLDWNNFVGPIPSQLGHLTNLVKLYLGRAFVAPELRNDGWKGSGDYSIPSELGLCTSLKELYLDNNDLTVDPPAEESTNVGVLLLNLGGPETGDDVEGTIVWDG